LDGDPVTEADGLGPFSTPVESAGPAQIRVQQ
jgi:hypothetical protein